MSPKKKSAPTEAAPYWWFKGASVEALVGALQAAGPGDARLEVRIDGKQKMTFRVVGPNDVVPTAERDIAESHVCPSDCA